MKLKSMMMVGAMIFFAAIGANAQTQNESRVKILRTPEPGVIKLLYAMNAGEPLSVKFITAEGEIARDEIRASKYPKGFLKNYNVKRIFRSDFRVEVVSPEMTVVYRIEPSKDRKSFKSHLERTTYTQKEVVASRK